jgi:phosphatidylserine/phosphatidylglycerophosphate/cardiolipin synthase-like enzyme
MARNKIVEVPRNAFVEADVAESVLLIDARNYYRTLYRALSQAQSYALVSGWQFETGVPLLRGADAEHAEYPLKFLEFLAACCAARPTLKIYLLAWEYSFVYAKEREWGQAEKFNQAHPNISFQWDPHPVGSASHHQKFVVVDGALGFLGGIDICDARWDDCDHRAEHPDRVNVVGDPCKPYHDLQAGVRGEIVASLEQIFVERWQRATEQALELPALGADERARFDLLELSGGRAEPIQASRAALSRTQVDPRAESAHIGEVQRLFSDAIAAAERSIYAETQYFTSRAVAKMFIARMRDQALPKLDMVVVLPHGADTPLEKLALEDAQEGVLQTLLDTARETGHELRLIYPASRTEDGGEKPTFIHSKVLIVDDCLLMTGSPNFTERSVALDTELAISWQSTTDGDPLSRSIAAIRSTLLAEHSGVSAKEFAAPRGLCAVIDRLLERGDTRLRRREVLEAGPLGPLFAELFDPGDAALADVPLA